MSEPAEAVGGYEHCGVLRYTIDADGYWLVAEVDPNLCAYYRALVPKGLPINRGRHDAHCTIVRGGRDVPPNMAAWGKYEGERVQFFCEHGIHTAGPYYWLKVRSKRFEEIRAELGLPVENGAYEPPPAPFLKYWHITIGSTKG
jgi:hypothetical protein